MIQEQTGRSCTLEGLYQEILGGGKRKKKIKPKITGKGGAGLEGVTREVGDLHL